MSGYFSVGDPELYFELWATTLAATRNAASNWASRARGSMAWCETFRAAKGGGYEWVTAPFMLELALRKPAAG